MFWKLLPWLFYGVIFSTIFGTVFFILSRIYGPKVAIKSLAQYTLLIGVVYGFFYAVLQLLNPSPFEIDIFRIIFYLASSVLSATLLFLHMKGKRQAASETILLDLGLDKSGFWLLLMGLYLIWAPLNSNTDGFEASQFLLKNSAYLVFSVYVGVLCFYRGIGNTLLTDRGIFTLTGYVKWSNIKSYEWIESKQPILKLKLINCWFSLNRAYLNVPNAHRHTVQELLSQNLPDPETT